MQAAGEQLTYITEGAFTPARSQVLYASSVQLLSTLHVRGWWQPLSDGMHFSARLHLHRTSGSCLVPGNTARTLPSFARCVLRADRNSPSDASEEHNMCVFLVGSGWAAPV